MSDPVITDLNKKLDDEDEQMKKEESREQVVADIAERILSDEKVVFGSSPSAYLQFDDVIEFMASNSSTQFSFEYALRDLIKTKNSTDHFMFLHNATSIAEKVEEAAKEVADKYADAYMAFYADAQFEGDD